ncbi:MAG: Clp protease N-terminal domain-containing protein [Rhodococcus sp. (in: high G+C Gram-positive bacteria)]
MFEKFTSEARLAVVAAQSEARTTKASRIDTVHLFLGIIDSAPVDLARILREEGYSRDAVIATLGDRDARALESIGIDLGAVRASLESTFGEGALDAPDPGRRGWFRRKTGHIAFASSAKKAIENSLREALDHGDSEIRCEHLLLGLIRGADPRFTDVVTDSAKLRERIDAT